jgi:hypothetical protein
LQGASDVLLSDDLGKFLRTVFASQDGVRHECEETIIRDVAAARGMHKSLNRRGR